MSKLFGPVVQQGYVVPDMNKAIDHWTARGVGPFFILPDHLLDAWHYGEPTKCRIKAAFAAWGDQQIELIEPFEDSGPNVYSDFLKEHPEGGMQHVAVWCDDVDGTLEKLKEDGVDYVLAQRYKGTHAYLDMADAPGIMIQLMPTFDRYLELFRVAEAEAENWDGNTDPVRDLGW